MLKPRIKRLIMIPFIYFFTITGIYSGNDVNTLNTEGQNLINRGQYNAALIIFKKAIELKPDYWFSYRNAGWVLNNKLNNPQLSISFFKKAIELAPNEPLPLVELANAFNKAKKYSDALNHYLASLNLFKRLNQIPYGSWIYTTISIIYSNHLNDKNKALETLLSAIKMFTDDADLLYNVGNFYKNVDNDKKAVQYYNNALLLYSKQNKVPPVWLIINASQIIFYKFNKHVEGIDFVLKKESLYRNEPIFYLHLAGMYSNDAKIHKAIEYYKKSLAMYRKKGETPPQHNLLALAGIYLFTLNPHQCDNAIPYLKEVLSNSSYELSKKESVVDWLAHAYIKTQNYPAFLELMNTYINRIADSGVKKKLQLKLAYYYYENELNMEKALNNAILAGTDLNLIKILKPKIIKLEYTFHLNKIMCKYITWNRPGIIHVTLPIEREYQKILEVKTNTQNHQIIDHDGLKYIKFDFSNGFPEILNICITIKSRVISRLPFNFKRVDSPTDPLYHIASQRTDYYDIDNPVLINAVNEITKNERTLKKKVKAVFKWISKNITHWSIICKRDRIQDTPENWPKFKKISEIYHARKGICNHISELFVGMMRILKVPARLIGGFIGSSAHVVVEIYDSYNKRWLYVEPQGFIPFGLNAWNHIIFNSDEIGKKYPKGHLNIGLLEHHERWNIGNSSPCKFSFSFIE